MALKIVDQNGQYVPDLFGDGTLSAALENIIIDRFLFGNENVTGNNTNANFGEKGWNTVFNANAGTVQRVISLDVATGIGDIGAHPTLGGRQAIYAGHAAVNGSFVNTLRIKSFGMRMRNISPGRFRGGLGDDASALGLGPNAILMGADNDIQDFWAVGVTRGGVATSILTDVPIDINTFVSWNVVINLGASLTEAASVDFTADGRLVGSFSNTPTLIIPALSTFVAPAVQAVTITPGPFQGRGQIDTFRMVLRDVPQL